MCSSDLVRGRNAERKQVRLSPAQRYVVRELGFLFKATDDVDLRAKISLLDRSFQGKVTRAVDREISALRRRGVSGEDFFSELVTIYNHHRSDLIQPRRSERGMDEYSVVSTIICSEAIYLS